MTTRKRNIMIASAAAAVIAVAATVTVVTLTPRNDTVNVGNALAMLSASDLAAPDAPDAPDNRTPEVTVSGGTENDTPVIILETEDSTAEIEESVLPESTNAPSNDKGNAEKEDVPDSTAAPSTAPSAKPESKPKSEPKPAPEDGSTPTSSSKPKADKPAVTVVTNPQEVTTPPSTIRDDLPKVEPDPKYTTASEDKSTQTEPTVVEKYDSDGFPANPTEDQVFTDSTGQSYIYDSLFGWIKYGDGDGVMQEFPDFYVEGGDEIILS